MTRVNVYVRQRPCQDGDAQSMIQAAKIPTGCQIVTRKDENSVEREMLLDGFWGGDVTQTQVFGDVGKQACDRALSGFNATIICFGPTSSGKSYTIFGEHTVGINSPALQSKGFDHPDNMKIGLVPRMLQYLFEQTKNRPQFEYNFHVSFVELYLDQPYDLLVEAPKSRPSSTNRNSRPGSALSTQRPGSAMNTSRPDSATGSKKGESEEQRQRLTLKQSIHGSFYAENLTVKSIQSAQEGLNLLQLGYDQRATQATQVNERSSRSHAIFTVGIIQKSRATGVATGSLLTFVDLAGAENLKKSNSVGQRQVEQSSINRTLSALGNVISKLATSQPHIPYRDSKLTKLLQEALGGSSYTVMICNIYPLLENDNETYLTLQFGNRCRNVVNNPKVGVTDISGIASNDRIRALVAEIEQLKGQNEQFKTENEDLKKMLEENGVDVDLEGVEQQKQTEFEFLKQISTLTPQEQEKARSKRRQEMENQSQRLNNSINNRSNNFNNSTKIQQSSKETTSKTATAPNAQTADASSTSNDRPLVQSLKQKVAAQSKDIYKLQTQLRNSETQLRTRQHELGDTITELRDRLEQQKFDHERIVNELQTQHGLEIKQIIQAQSQAARNQQSIIDNFTSLVPGLTMQRQDFLGNSGHLVDDPKVRISELERLVQQKQQELDNVKKQLVIQQEEYKSQILQQMDQQKRAEMQQLHDRHCEQVERMKADLQNESAKCDQKLRQYEAFVKKAQESLLFVFNEYRRVATLVMEAKEGKIDSYIINEQQIIQDFMNYDFSSKRQRRPVKAALIIPPERDLQVLPTQVMEMINEVQAKETENLLAKRNEGTLTSRPQSTRSNKVHDDFMQPKMVTRGFSVKAKPPDVRLETNLHISPRPQSQRNITDSMRMSMNLSSSKRPHSSQVGSMGGTKELVNKQYQQWGF